MSSDRKRSALHKAAAAENRLRQELMMACHHRDVYRMLCEQLAKEVDKLRIGGCEGGSKWTHYRNGGAYTIIGSANLQTDVPLEDMATLTIYRGEDGKLWARDPLEFDGRFDKVLEPLNQAIQNAISPVQPFAAEGG